jgi:holliday junction DNA helicase RuvA
MIEFVKGKLVEKTPTQLVVETQGGVAYVLLISVHTFEQIGSDENVKVYAHLSIKEDAHTLYGFAERGERNLFRHLISVSGIGPNTARMMLSSNNPSEIQQAIVQGNIAKIQKIKGIGPKSAQRLVLELQDKLKKEGLESLIHLPEHNTSKEEALSALMVLGFNKNAAEKALNSISQTHGSGLSVEQFIKLSLQVL